MAGEGATTGGAGTARAGDGQRGGDGTSLAMGGVVTTAGGTAGVVSGAVLGGMLGFLVGTMLGMAIAEPMGVWYAKVSKKKMMRGG
jgi:hypothetical protein